MTARLPLTARKWDAAWAVAAGALHAAALSPWAKSWASAMPALMQSLALVGLLVLLCRQVRPRSAAWLGWLYGSLWLVGATGWMFVSLHRFGGLPAWLSALAVGLLCAALSIYMALACWAWARWRAGVAWRDALLFGALWLLAELARALIFTGFPWGASGYGLIDTPWQHLAPLGGVYVMGWVWATCLAWVVLTFSSPKTNGEVSAWPKRFAPLALLVLGMGWGGVMSPSAYTRQHAQPIDVTLLQSNVPQNHKFDPQRQIETLRWHARALLTAKGDLVVAPETAIPLLPMQLPEGFWALLTDHFAKASTHALIGIPLGDPDQGYTNSVVGLSAASLMTEGSPYRYDKHHLVPFGEFIPTGFRWFVRMMNMPLGDFSRGPLAAPSFSVAGQRVAPNICYEDLFGEEIATRFVNVSTAPTMLANVSNLAWFGDSVAIHQHLQIARMRSLEFQLPTIRSTNTGATVVIDHRGQVTHALPANTQGQLTATVQGMHGVTPFAWWAGRWGLWPLIVVAFFIVLGLAFWQGPRGKHAGI